MDLDKLEAPKPYNPWRESLENCISGDNYLRSSEYQDLIEYIDSLLAERATAASGAAKWLSIKTAPKDGTNVLLINRAGNMAAGLWNGLGAREGWWLRGGSGPNVFFNGHHGPTHWMPLPPAPNADKPKDGFPPDWEE